MAEAVLPGHDGKPEALPRYRSHKEVWALEIASIDIRSNGTVTLAFVEPFAPLTVERSLVQRYMPIPHDWLICYRDGYRSISPRVAFEEGYERVK